MNDLEAKSGVFCINGQRRRVQPGDRDPLLRRCCRVLTGDGKSRTWWEFKLRFKTDGSPDGPSTGKPVIVGSDMQGERAAVVFSRPEEISMFIRRECP